MKKFMSIILSAVVSFALVFPAPAIAEHCDKSSGAFKVFPTWYKYLEDKLDDSCSIKEFQPQDAWKVVLALVEGLLRLAGVVALCIIIYMGFKFVLSRGNPTEAAKARQGIIDAVIGMVIASSASVIVTFLARSLIK